MNKKFLSLFAGGALAWAAASIVAASDISAHLANLNAADYDLRQAARLDLRQALVAASPRELKAYERELLAAIGPDRDWATRDWSIRMLELVGTAAAVKPLAALLDDPDPRVRDLARRALSAIPARRAGAVLEKSAARAAAEEQAAYADALAYRHEGRSGRRLRALLDAGSAEAALALGKIGGRAALSALTQAHAKAEDGSALKRDIELALLDAELSDRGRVRSLAESGQTASIRAAAFARLVSLDREAAATVLDAALAAPISPERSLWLRTAMGSPLSDNVVARLADLTEAEQIVVLDAVADLHLAKYEAAVLALLDAESEALRSIAVRTLGHVGSDASFQPLLDRHLADERDREITAALARLQAPSTDAKLLATVQGTGDLGERVAALRLLVLRNTAGVTALVNRLGLPVNPAELRLAAFRGMEVVGDPGSARLLLDVILREDDPVKRQAQGSLKKLSANLAVPDFLWTGFYEPALAAAANDDRRRDILAIIDGNSGPLPAAYLQRLVIGDHALKEDALNALRRWTDISGVDAWLSIATAEGATSEEVATAKQSIIRLVGSVRTSGLYPEKVERAALALRTLADDTDFQKALLRTYQRELHWQTRIQISRLFPEFLDNAAIAAEVQELLDRAKFN